MVAGGADSYYFNQTELYDPASGAWTTTDNLETDRNDATLTLLLDGQVLITGGTGYDNRSELYNVGLAFSSDWQPVITTATMTKQYRLQLTSSRFQGISGASGGGYQDSSTNYPVVQLRHLDSEQVTFLFVDPARGWSDSSFFSLPARGFVPGPALATVFTNGIPSDAKYLVVPQ
jgi:hypothetical protein